MITRRSLFFSALAAPFIVRAGSLMPVRAVLRTPDTWAFDVGGRSVMAWQRALYEAALSQMRFVEFIRPPAHSAASGLRLCHSFP